MNETELWKVAREAEAATGVNAALIVAQYKLESGNGKSAPGNNFFGVKGAGTAGSQRLETTENINGKDVRKMQNFAVYDTPLESFIAHAKLISEDPRYAKVMEASKSGDLNAIAEAIGSSPYATDPLYGQKIAQIMGVYQSPLATPTPTVASMTVPRRVMGASTSRGEFIPSNAKLLPTQEQKSPTQVLTTPTKNGLVEQIKAVPQMISSAFNTAVQNFTPGSIEGFLPGSPTVTGTFGARNPQYWGGYAHEGTDFRAAENTPVNAPEGWMVRSIQSEDKGTYGKNVVIENPKTGERMQFAHLSQVNNMLQPGMIIQKGPTQQIATTGSTGTGLGGQKFAAHLHVNYWDSKGKKQDVTKVIKDVALGTKIQNAINPVKQAQAAEKQFSTTIVKTPPVMKQPIASFENPKASFEQPLQFTPNKQLVKPGDTLANIAKSYNTSWQNLAKMNPQVKDPNKLFTGEALVVPTARVVATAPKKSSAVVQPKSYYA